MPQPGRSAFSRHQTKTGEKQIMTNQIPHMKLPPHEMRQRNHLETISSKTTVEWSRLKPVLFMRKLILNSVAAPNYKYIFNLYRVLILIYHSEAHVIKKIVMKQSYGLNGDLKPDHKKTTKRATIGPTTIIDSQAPTI